jgi:hypothetical protein
MIRAVSPRARTALVCGLALFGVYHPSSVARVISQPLNILALTGTLAGLLALWRPVAALGPSAIQASCVAEALASAPCCLLSQRSPRRRHLAIFCVMLVADLRAPQDGGRPCAAWRPSA